MFENESWFQRLSKNQQSLVNQSYSLLKQSSTKFHDYSFIVFPMAKAYEGFLKKYFFETGLISKCTYEGDRFRIGKALNPALPPKHRGSWWLYGPLTQQCGKELPEQLWQAWRQCRNRLFHFFPKDESFITIQAARQRLEQLKAAIAAAVSCDLKNIDNQKNAEI